MEFKVEHVVFTPDPALWKEFTQSPTGTVGSDLKKRARKLIVLAVGSVPKHHGALARSLSFTYFPTPDPYVLVGSSVKYAYWVHEGTRPHLIHEENGRLLRFIIKGRVVYARVVKHPGTQPTHFLSRHLRKVI